MSAVSAERERPAWIRLLPAVVLAAVAAAYSNCLRASYQFDDWSVIVDEPPVSSLSAWWASLPAIRPLLKLTYALNNSLDLREMGFHLFNIGVHAANAILVFALLERLARREKVKPVSATMMALTGALLFALHPVQTEAVTYISGRSTSLAAFFSLASLLAWIAGRTRSRQSAFWMIFSAVLFALALLVKETAVVVPLAILLWESARLRRSPSFPGPLRIPWAHLGILAAGLLSAAFSPTYRRFLSVSLQARGIGANLLTQADATIYLLGQLVRFDRLNADPALPVLDWSLGVALEAFLLIALLAVGLLSIRHRPALAFGILWFFLFLAPTNSFLPRLDVANDRQLYLAMLGPVWLLVWSVGNLLPRRPVAPLALLACATLLLGMATWQRNLVYADEITFWMDVARKSPHNARAFNNLGYAYALQARNVDAEKAFQRALELNPHDVRAAVNLRLLREGALLSRPPHP